MRARRKLAVVVVIVLAAGLAYYLVDPFGDDFELGGTTEDAIAAEIEDECDAKRAVVTDSRLQAYPPMGTRAENVIEIACSNGDVAPIGFLYRFRTAADLDVALTEGGEKPQMCILGREAYTLTFGDASELCGELGGELRGLAFVTP